MPTSSSEPISEKGFSSNFLNEEIISIKDIFHLIGKSILEAQYKMDLGLFKPSKRRNKHKPKSNHIDSEFLGKETKYGLNIFPQRYMFKESDIELKFDLIVSNKTKKHKKGYMDKNKLPENQEIVSEFFIDTFRQRYQRKYLNETGNNVKLKTKVVASSPPKYSD